MIDVEELREALQTRPAEPWPELDIQQIMTTGRRLRRRRQLRTGVITGAGLSAVLIAGMMVSQTGGRTSADLAAGPALTSGSAPQATANIQVTTTADPPTVSPADRAPTVGSTPLRGQPAATLAPSKPLGDVVFLKNPKDTAQALYMVAADPDVAGVDHGLVFGRSKKGELIDQVQIQALDASERTQSFRAFYRASLKDPAMPSFGYYTGPATSIYATGRLNKRVPAKQIQWSQDPGTVIFWFEAGELASIPDLTSLTATNSDGTLVSIKLANLGISRP